MHKVTNRILSQVISYVTFALHVEYKNSASQYRYFDALLIVNWQNSSNKFQTINF